MRFSYKLSLLIGVAFAQLSVPASAQDKTSAGSEEQSASIQDTVIVEGRSLRTDATPVMVLSGDEFLHRRQGTLGETLSALPGIHTDNFGGGASRPVIRGQTVPRIEILSDGAALFDASSVSPDHAVVTDPLLLDAIEIQRGSAAAIYGGNAVNGAINLIDSKVPRSLPENGITGAGEVRYSTADNGLATAGRATMGIGSSFAVHIEGSSGDANNYNIPDGFGSGDLKDSFAQNGSYSVGASWLTDKGYIGAAFTHQEAEYGLPGHSHANAGCHNHSSDLHCEAHDEFTDPFIGSDDNHTARIDLRSERVDIRADYDRLLPGIDHTRLRLSYTDYRHDEIDGSILFTSYTNEVFDARMELTHTPFLGLSGILGAQYTDGTFSGLNFNTAHEEVPDLGFVEPLDYNTENFAVFLNERRSFGPVDLEFAARKDWRKVSIPVPYFNIAPIYEPSLILFFGPDGVEKFKSLQIEGFPANNPEAKHEPLSASVSATWDMGAGYSTALSLGHTERAPSVRELYAGGNNLATNSLEVGLAKGPDFSSTFPDRTTNVEEKTDSVDLTFRKTSGQTEFEFGLFHQKADNYIFASLIDEEAVGHRYLLYTMADAHFTGIDGQVSHQLNDASKVTLFGDYVRAALSDEDDNLPRIPPGRLGVRYNWETGPLTADFEYYHTFEQDRIASYETKTDGYDMLNATVSYGFDLSSGKNLKLYARGTNLTDELAFVHTSFVKDQSPLRGRNIVFGVRADF